MLGAGTPTTIKRSHSNGFTLRDLKKSHSNGFTLRDLKKSKLDSDDWGYTAGLWLTPTSLPSLRLSSHT